MSVVFVAYRGEGAQQRLNPLPWRCRWICHLNWTMQSWWGDDFHLNLSLIHPNTKNDKRGIVEWITRAFDLAGEVDREDNYVWMLTHFLLWRLQVPYNVLYVSDVFAAQSKQNPDSFSYFAIFTSAEIKAIFAWLCRRKSFYSFTCYMKLLRF